MNQLVETDQARPQSPIPSKPQAPTSPLPAPTALPPNPSPFAFSSNFKPLHLTFAQSQSKAGTTIDESSTMKRSAFEDLRDRVDKRIKASHTSPVSDHNNTTTAISDHAGNYPPSPAFLGPSRRTASDYMQEGSSIGIVTPTGTAPVLVAPLDRIPIPRTDIAIPRIPLEAIETLQQASSNLLTALVNKDAVDRERRLMVAVGTIRTCLEIEFAPHMEIWKEDAKNRALTNLHIGPQESRSSTSSRPPPGTPTGPRDDKETDRLVDPSRVAVRMQLAEAQVNLRSLEKQFRDQESELVRAKDENKMISIQLAKSKQETRNLSTLLAASKLEAKKLSTQLQAKTTALTMAKVDRDKTVTTLNKTIDEQKRKIAAQKTSIQGLENQNERLKDKAVVKPPQPRSGKKRQGNRGVVLPRRGHRQMGLMRRGDSMEMDGQDDEATTPRPSGGLEYARSSTGVGPTILRSQESSTPIKLSPFDGFGGLTSTGSDLNVVAIRSGTGSNRVSMAPSVIRHQGTERDWASGEKTEEHQAEEMRDMRHSGVVEKDHGDEMEEGELVGDYQRRWGDDTWVSDSRRDADWGNRGPGDLWTRHTPPPVVRRGQGMTGGLGAGQRLEVRQKLGSGGDQLEAGPSSYPAGSMIFSYSAGRNVKEAGPQ